VHVTAAAKYKATCKSGIGRYQVAGQDVQCGSIPHL
jgi:hypothetical protein